MESDPTVRAVQSVGVWRGRLNRTGVGPTQQPVLAVCEDSHSHSALFFRLLQVLVQLSDVVGVGVKASCCSDPALEFHKCVEGSQVYGATGTLGRRILLDYVARPD